MDRVEAIHFAEAWIRQWNARDLDAILEHYADGVRFISPTAARVTGKALVEGKDALGAYWRAALNQINELRFALDHIAWDEGRQELVIVYARVVDGRADRACEFFRFDEDELVEYGEAMYGAEG